MSLDLFDHQLAVAIDLHNEGVAGSAQAVREANEAFEQLRDNYPGHPLVNAYYGSVMALLARDESNPLERFRLASRGMALLDEATAAAPRSSTVRMLRGNVAYRLPEHFFHRTETAIEDYIMLIDGELSEPGNLAAETYAKLVYELGEAYFRIDRHKEAKMCWRYLLEQTDDPKYIELCRQKLQSVGETEAEPAGKEPFKNPELQDWIGVLMCVVSVALVQWAGRKK